MTHFTNASTKFKLFLLSFAVLLFAACSPPQNLDSSTPRLNPKELRAQSPAQQAQTIAAFNQGIAFDESIKNQNYMAGKTVTLAGDDAAVMRLTAARSRSGITVIVYHYNPNPKQASQAQTGSLMTISDPNGMLIKNPKDGSIITPMLRETATGSNSTALGLSMLSELLGRTLTGSVAAAIAGNGDSTGANVGVSLATQVLTNVSGAASCSKCPGGLPGS